MAEYKYDIAFSLCKEDLEFARKLIKALNPTLKVFFYETKQEELITKSGPEAFGKIFKDDARVVVILSRKAWSESFYTDIERNAIIDRTAVKNQGYDFLMVIPLEQAETPSWYPSTRIYVDPKRFTIEEIAKFIEFKITDNGGKIETLSVEDRYQHFLNKINDKKQIIQLQHKEEALEQARQELKLLQDFFNKKIHFLEKTIFDATATLPFSGSRKKAYVGIGDYFLECQLLLPDEIYNRIVTTQDFCVQIELYKVFGNNRTKKSLELEQRLFYYSPTTMGWALPHLHEQPTERELDVLFHNRDNKMFYDLTKLNNSQQLIDEWFQKFLSLATGNIERYL